MTDDSLTQQTITGVSDLAYAASDTWWHIIRFINSGERTPRTSDSLTIEQTRILRSLDEEGRLSMSRVAEIGRVTRGAATGMVARLVQRKLVRRMEDESNRRLVLVDLLPEGRKAIAEVKERTAMRIHLLLQHLGTREREGLRRSLEALEEAVRLETAGPRD